jgi:hypothetical protein
VDGAVIHDQGRVALAQAITRTVGSKWPTAKTYDVNASTPSDPRPTWLLLKLAEEEADKGVSNPWHPGAMLGDPRTEVIFTGSRSMAAAAAIEGCWPGDSEAEVWRLIFLELWHAASSDKTRVFTMHEIDMVMACIGSECRLMYHAISTLYHRRSEVAARTPWDWHEVAQQRIATMKKEGEEPAG